MSFKKMVIGYTLKSTTQDSVIIINNCLIKIIFRWNQKIKRVAWKLKWNYDRYK